MSRRKVLWKNGTLLAPQHLQQADRYLESVLQLRSPHAFGLLECTLDETALAGGKFGLRRCLAVLPDGLLVDIGSGSDQKGGDDAAPAGGEVSITSGAFGVWLALPERLADARYVEDTEQAVDDYNTKNIRPVIVGKKNLRYVYSNQSREGLVSLQLAMLERDGPTRLVAQPKYIPTCLALRGSPWFAGFLRRLNSRLESRIRELVRKSSRSVSEECLLMLMSGFLPRLRHLEGEEVQRATHPEQLFAMLLELAGGLGYSLDKEKEPYTLPQYEHTRLTECFGALESRLDFLLAVKSRSRVLESITMDVSNPDDVFWTGKLTTAHLRNSKVRLFLVVIGGELPQETLIKLVAENGRLGGTQRLRKAYGLGWNGLPMEFVVGPGLEHYNTGRGESLYFRMKLEEYPLKPSPNEESNNLYDLWKEIRDTGDVSFYLPRFDLKRSLPRIDLIVVQDEAP